MKLTSEAQEAVNKNTALKTRLAVVMGKSVYTIQVWVNKNEENGGLTTASALEVISQLTGIPQSELLEKENKQVA